MDRIVEIAVSIVLFIFEVVIEIVVKIFFVKFLAGVLIVRFEIAPTSVCGRNAVWDFRL